MTGAKRCSQVAGAIKAVWEGRTISINFSPVQIKTGLILYHLEPGATLPTSTPLSSPSPQKKPKGVFYDMVILETAEVLHTRRSTMVLWKPWVASQGN